MPDTVDARIPLQIGQGIPQYGPNWNAIAQMQKQQMLQQQAQQEVQARNALKQFYSDQSNFDDKGIPSTQKLNSLIGMSPAAGEVALGNTLKAQQFGNQNALRQSTLMGKMQTDAARALETANGIYKESMAAGMSEVQAKQRAQEYWTDQRKALTAGQSPEIAQSIPSAFDPIMAGAVGITNEQRLTNERLEKSGYKLEKQQNPGGGVSQIWVKAGAPSLDMGGNPVTPTGMPAPTAAEAKPDYVGSIKGSDGKVVKDVPLLYQNGAWIDSRTQKPVAQDQVSGIRKMGAGGTQSSPEAIQTTAELVAAYKSPPPGSYAMSRGNGPEIMKAVKEINPQFDATKYVAANAMRRSFATGIDGRAVDSVNTAVQHLGVFDDLAKALGNKDTNAINRVMNYVSAELGHPEVTNFNTAKQVIADEVVKAVVGSGAVFDRESMQKQLNDARSPEQLMQQVDKIKQLMAGRVASLEKRWTANGLADEEFQEKLLPDTMTAIDRYLPKKKGEGGAETTAPPHRGSQEGQVVPIAPAQQASPAPGKGGTFTLRKGSEQADYDSLPAGAEFIGPDGKLRKKP